MADKKAFIINDFKDAAYGEEGVERRFAAGDIVTISEGAFINYEHAGLVRAPTADDKKPSAPAT